MTEVDNYLYQNEPILFKNPRMYSARYERSHQYAIESVNDPMIENQPQQQLIEGKPQQQLIESQPQQQLEPYTYASSSTALIPTTLSSTPTIPSSQLVV